MFYAAARTGRKYRRRGRGLLAVTGFPDENRIYAMCRATFSRNFGEEIGPAWQK